MNGFIIEKHFMIGEYRCVVVEHVMGHRCGYVGLPKGHLMTDEEADELQVHGGITYYSIRGSDDARDFPVESDCSWIGFDCSHYMNGKDFVYANKKGIRETLELYRKLPNYGEVRTTEYVENELIAVVEQLKSLNKTNNIFNKLSTSLKKFFE